MTKKINKKIVMTVVILFLLLACGVGLAMFVQMAQAANVDNITLETGIAGETNIPAQGGITTYIKLIYQFASGIVAGLAAIMLVIGGIQYATAAGNPKAIASAKETIISAIIGLVIVATGYLILGLFGTQFTNLSDPTLPDASYDEGPPNPPEEGLRCNGRLQCQMLPGEADSVCSGKGPGDDCGASSDEDCAQMNNNPDECTVHTGCMYCQLPGAAGGGQCFNRDVNCSEQQMNACNDQNTCRPYTECTSVNDNSNECRAARQQHKNQHCNGCNGTQLKPGPSGYTLICCRH